MSEKQESGTAEAQDLQEELRSTEVPNLYVDAAINVVILLGAVAFLAISGQFADIRSSVVDPGAAYWPRAVLIVIIFAGVVNLGLILKRIRNEIETDPSRSSSRLSEVLGPDGLRDSVTNLSDNQKKYVLATLSIFVYIGLLTRVGFISITPFFLFAFAWIDGYRKPLKLAAFSVGMTLILFAAFRVVMNIAFPTGEGVFREISFFFEGLFSDILP